MKHIHRFFISQQLKPGDSVCLEDEDGFHARKVLRLTEGEAVELADAAGRVFTARLTGMDGRVEAEVGAKQAGGAPPADVRLTVVQALPAGRKMDLIVEKLSELGIHRLVPVYSELSVARPSGKGGGKLERWRRIARSAAAQSKRRRIMEVAEPAGLGKCLNDGWEKENGPLLLLCTEEEGVPLGRAVESLVAAAGQPPVLAIGPEAGFSSGEIESFRQAGAIYAGLGTQVLRTETAALVAASIVLHRLGALG